MTYGLPTTEFTDSLLLLEISGGSHNWELIAEAGRTCTLADRIQNVNHGYGLRIGIPEV